MAFQLKDFKSILASMVNWVRSSGTGLTDFSVGSTNRTMLEAPAAEIDQLYQEMFNGLKEAIPVATFQSFNFDLLPEQLASGLLTFTANQAPTSNITIQAGTTVRSQATGRLYETAQNAVLLAGQTTVSVLAIALTPGAEGNADANTITELQVNINGVDSVTNQAAFNNGRSEETEQERKTRFQGFISTLARGVVEAIRYGAENAFLEDANGLITERVAFAGIVEPYKTNPAGPIALVQVHVHNGVGGTSVELVDHVQMVLDGYRKPDGTPVYGWKAAGVVVEVYASAEVPWDVTGEIVFTDNADTAAVLTQAEDVVTEYLLGLPIGVQAIRHEIVEQIMRLPGVYDVSLSVPAANSAIDETQKIMPGVITLTEAP